MAMIVHAVMNASDEMWKILSEYTVRPASAAEAAAETGHVYLMLTVVSWLRLQQSCSSTDRSTCRAVPGSPCRPPVASPERECNNRPLRIAALVVSSSR
jgi:hypothetical protein